MGRLTSYRLARPGQERPARVTRSPLDRPQPGPHRILQRHECEQGGVRPLAFDQDQGRSQDDKDRDRHPVVNGADEIDAERPCSAQRQSIAEDHSADHPPFVRDVVDVEIGPFVEVRWWVRPPPRDCPIVKQIGAPIKES